MTGKANGKERPVLVTTSHRGVQSMIPTPTCGDARKESKGGQRWIEGGSGARKKMRELGLMPSQLILTPTAKGNMDAPAMAKWKGAWTDLLPTPNVPNGGRSVPKRAEWNGRTATLDGNKIQVGLEHVLREMLPAPTARDTRSDRASEQTMAKNSRPLSEQSGHLGLTGTVASPVSQRRALLLGLVLWMMGQDSVFLQACATAPLPRSGMRSSHRSPKRSGGR